MITIYRIINIIGGIYQIFKYQLNKHGSTTLDN